MGGLGNGRRGGRAPTLMVAALIACILVLGFNYWVSSAHNLELQTKLNELEDRVRRGAAERGEAEMKKKAFQEQIGRIESVHRKELDDVRNTHSQEKAKLLENISSMTKTIEELKGQLNQQNEDLRKLQKELQSCKADTSALNNKLTVDMAHCQSQVLSQKKLCDEKVAAVKLEVQKNTQKALPVPADPAQKNAETGGEKEDPTVKAVPSEGETITAAAASQNPNIPQGKRDKASELLTNDIVERDFSEQPPSDELPKVESQTALSTASDTRNKLPPNEGEGKTAKAEATPGKGLTNNLTGDGDIEVMDVHEDGAQTEDPGMEDMLIGQGKPDTDADQKLEEADEYDTDEHVVGGSDLEKEQRNRNMEEEMADYNGDDENEGEFEADKQAALAQI